MKYPIKVTKAKESRIHEMDTKDMPFGKHYSDHMFLAEYHNGEWENCRIVPFGNLELNPATSSLHYGQLIFEGMKAYKDTDGNPLLFRPDMNMKRMNLSAHRMGMPEIPEELFMSALHELVSLDKDWIPALDGYSLYIRPVLMATDEFIGVRPTDNFLFYIILSPSEVYYTKPVKVMTTKKYVRAFPGGTGFAKAAGNYGGAMLPLREARAAGYDQILWLDGFEFKYAEEIGTMNVFFIIDDILITPELDGTILDGVTRDSVIKIAKHLGLKVEERKISLDEVENANHSARLQDAFGAGTAAAIAPISQILYNGTDIILPPVENRIWSGRIKRMLEDIRMGKEKDIFEWTVKVKSSTAAKKKQLV